MPVAFVPILLALASVDVNTTGIAEKVRTPLAMTSPWWENYDLKDRYLCSGKGGVVLERNDSQASLISGGTRTTLFREPSDRPGLIYRNDDLRLILRGDELTVERYVDTITCFRSDEG